MYAEILPPVVRGGPVPHLALPHMAVEECAPLPGETIRAFVDRTGWENGPAIVCYELNDDGSVRARLRAEWFDPIDERRLAFVSCPQGGGGAGGSRSGLALAGMIALMVLANFATAGMASAGFAIAGKLLGVLIVAGGSMLISHFMKPKAPNNSIAPAYDFSLGNNQARPGAPIPIQYGKDKFMPDYAAPPWSDYAGLDQTYHALFCLGHGVHHVHQLEIAGTPIWNETTGFPAGFGGATTSTGVQVGVGETGAIQGVGGDVQFQLIGPGAPVTLFAANVTSAPGVNSITFPDPYGTMTNGIASVGPNGETSGPSELGPFIINAAGTIARRGAFDFAAPGGLYYSDPEAGKDFAIGVEIVGKVREVDDQGHPIGDWVTVYSELVYRLTKSPYRWSAPFEFPSAGRFEAKAFRTNAATTSGASGVVWVSARAYIDGPETRPHVTLLAVKAKADKLLSGYSGQQIAVISTRKIPVWNGTAWVEQATRNPFWAAADLWANDVYSAGLDRNKLDIPTFAALADEADARGDAFDYRFTNRTSVIEALTTALASVRAYPLPMWDRLSVARDEPRPVPRLMLTDLEIDRGTYSADFRFSTVDQPDGVVVQYRDNATWRMEEVASSGNLATLARPTRVVLLGVTERAQAFDHAVHLARANIARRSPRSIEVEGEGKLVQRGDLIALSTELPGTMGRTMRLESYDLSVPLAPRITLHAPLDWVVEGQRYIRSKGRRGQPFGPVKCERGANDDEVIIDATDLALVEAQQAQELADCLVRSPYEEAPSAVVSVGAPQEFLGLVHDIAAGSQKGHIKLDLVPYAADIMYADNGTVPALPSPPALVLPKVPGLISGLGATFLQEQAHLTLRATWQPDTGSDTYEAEYTLDDGVSWQSAYNGYAAQFEVKGFSGTDLKLRVRGRRGERVSVAWSQITVTAPEIAIDLKNIGALVKPGDLTQDAINEVLKQAGVVAEASTQALNARIVLGAATTTAGGGAIIELMVQTMDHLTPISSGLSLEIYETAPGSNVFKSRTIMKTDALYLVDGTSMEVPFAYYDGKLILQNTAYIADAIKSLGNGANGQPFLTTNYGSTPAFIFDDGAT